ncbi:MAG: beta-ketoacyl-[acyl-carrier-protein] synthase family protein [Planctomycetota bacterium]
MSDDSQRIVVTGMGWITPLGHDLDTVWSRMMKGDCGIAPIDRFDARTFPTTFAAQVRDYDFTKYVDDPERHKHAGLHSQFVLGAARQAWNQSGLGDVADLDHRRMGIYLGAGEGPVEFETSVKADYAAWNADTQTIDAARWAEAAFKHMSAAAELEQEPNMPAWHLANEYDVRGPVYNCLTACAASTQAIGEASSILRRGDADVMISGGTHTMLHVLGVTGFNRLTALSTRTDDIMTASRPFSRSRDGFVMGEGAGVVILETLEHARKRGATPQVELIGYGSSADAFRITDIQPDGRGAAAAMHQALRQAGLDPHGTDEQGRPAVHYISAHGTGTKENDSIETRAVKRVFEEMAPKIPMSSIKSMMGHLIAAAGAVEVVAAAGWNSVPVRSTIPRSSAGGARRPFMVSR